MKKTIIFAGGGSGGHIYPSLALADELEALGYKSLFIGTSRGLEAKIVPAKNKELILLPMGPLHPSVGIKVQILSMLKIPASFIKSLIILIKYRPSYIIGVGGYASFPVLFMGSLLRFKTGILELNAFPGLTNRVLAKFVQNIFIAFDSHTESFSAKKITKVNIPIRAEFEEKSMGEDEKKTFHSKHFEKESYSNKKVLVVGGSQGSKFLNQRLPGVLSKIEGLSVIHQTGIKAVGYKSVGSPSFNTKKYLDPILDYYNWADFVICRAGSNTLAELSALGKPSLLIPLSTSSNDHQKLNAQYLVNQDAAYICEEKDVTDEWLKEFFYLLTKDQLGLEQVSKNFSKMHKNGALKHFVSTLETLASS